MMTTTDVTQLEAWHAWSFRSGSAWTDWHAFSPSTLALVSATPGAYVLGLPAGVPLGRLLRADPHRLLDVGEASNLNKRLNTLWRCATTQGTPGHMAGWRLGSMQLLARLGCRADELRVSWCMAGTKSEAYSHEGALLRTYFDLFGELPPLNYKFNWSGLADEDE